MKNIFITLKKKHIIILLFIIFAICLVFFAGRVVKSSSPKANYTVVIDAGHGGIDGGAVGKNSGMTEADLNLDYAKYLKNMMEEFGFKVVMTRSSSDGLYNPLA